MNCYQPKLTKHERMITFLFEVSESEIDRLVMNANQMLYIMGYKHARCRINDGTNSGVSSVDIVEYGDVLASRDQAKIIGYVQGWVDCLNGGEKWNAR